MSEKHSELPWSHQSGGQLVIDSSGGIIAYTGGSNHITKIEKIANAAFIVEACNNYEAVKKERDELREELSSFIAMLESGECPSDEDITKAKKLLNK